MKKKTKTKVFIKNKNVDLELNEHQKKLMEGLFEWEKNSKKNCGRIMIERKK